MSQLNKEQTRHVNAFNNLEFFFGENKDIYAGNKPVQNWVNRLLSNNKAIVSLSTTKGTGSEGATKTKDNLKESIALNGGTVCSYAADYAVTTGNTELFALVNYSASDISGLRDALVLGFINGVVDAVTPLLSLPGFKDYPVTGDDLSALSKDANDFNNYLGKNKLIINNSHVASHTIDSYIKDNRNVIIRLDTLIPNFKKDAPKFVEGYFKAKRIDNTGIRHSGVVADIQDNRERVIDNATITLTRKETVKTATISDEGTYEIIKCTAGNWKLTIAAPGYETQTVTIKIIRGEIRKLSIILQSAVMQMQSTQTA